MSGLDEIEKLLWAEVLDLGDTRPQVARDVGNDVLAELELVGDEGVAFDDRAKLAVNVLACKRSLGERDK